MFSKNLVFTGKHARFLRELAPAKGAGEQQGQTVFQNNMDVVKAAPLIGFCRKHPSPVDHDKDVTDNNIFTEQVLKIQADLTFAYRLIMLLDAPEKFSVQERLDKAFRYDNQEEKRKPGDDVFWAYVRGGIEVLHEELVENSSSLSDDVMAVADFLDQFRAVDCLGFSAERLEALCRKAGV